jgi:sugar phosphate isomerase/epimerase
MKLKQGKIKNIERLPWVLRQSLSRRDFLQAGGMGLLGATLVLPAWTAIEPTKWRAAKLSVQLYTVRNQMNTDIPGTLKRVADIGFKSVETAFWPEGITVQKAGQYIREAGLSVSSAHIEIPIGDKKQAMLDTAAAYGCTKMIWHGWPEDKRYSTLEGTMELVSIYNEAGKFAKANGLQFGVHNHWWEYRNKVDGRFVYEVLLENLDQDVFFEVDTYWVKVAGQDPAVIVKRMGSRAPLLHIKDGPAIWNDSLPKDNPDPMTAVGKGTQNFPAIVKAADGNTEWMVVEMDRTATDVFEALKESYDYLINNKLARVS